mgnify:CR=1 FL=1
MRKILPIIALCVLGVSCNQTQDTGYGKDNNRSTQEWSDTEITTKVKAVILADMSLSPGNRFVSITTTNGVVVITGNVSSADQKRKIAQKAEKVSGVRRVENQMTVSDS